MDNLVRVKIAAPFLLVIAGILAVRFIDYKLTLTPSEIRMVDFVQEEAVLRKKGERAAVRQGIRSPIDIPRGQAKGFPPVPLEQAAPMEAEHEETGPGFKVTMIVIGGKSKMAIVNGAVVSEGAAVGGAVVKRIERDRVLISVSDAKTGKITPIWLSLEEIRNDK